MKFIRVGRLLGGHGLEGELRLMQITDNPELFDSMEYLMLARDGSLVRSYEIESIREHKGHLLVFVTGIETLEEADSLKGLDVVVHESSLPEPDEDEVYWYKIEGAAVVTESGDVIGSLVDYMEAGGAEVFRIALEGGGHAMISNNNVHVLKIDAAEKKVIINPDGLVHENV